MRHPAPRGGVLAQTADALVCLHERHAAPALTRESAARPAGSLGGFVAPELLLELLDAEEQLVDVALAAHQAGVHRRRRLQLLFDAVPSPDVLDRDRGLLRKRLELLEVTSRDRIEVVAIDVQHAAAVV